MRRSRSSGFQAPSHFLSVKAFHLLLFHRYATLRYAALRYAALCYAPPPIVMSCRMLGRRTTDRKMGNLVT